MSEVQTELITQPGERLQEDFIREQHIKPHKRQEDFLALSDDIFEALYGGAAYGGKSWILTMLPLFRGFHQYRGFKGIILRRKFPDLEREIIRLSKEWYPKTGGIYNEQKHTWEWREFGSYMDFGHVQHASDISMYDSAQYNYAGFDELTHFPEYPYVYMMSSRVRPGNGNLRVAIGRHGTNPGGVGQTFVHNRFVKPAPDGYVRLKDSKTGLYRIFIPAYYTDNPFGLEFDPRYGDKLEGLPEAEKKAKKYGDWNAFKGSVFTTFRPIRFPGEPQNALHVIEPFAIPEWWPRILSIDWGKKAMTYAMWGAISPQGQVFVYRERAWTGTDIAIWAAEIREIHDENNETPIHTVLCGSAWQDRGNTRIVDIFTQHSGLAAASSENSPGSRIIGLNLIHDFLRWEPKKTLKAKGEFFDLEKYQFLIRNHGEEAAGRYKNLFIDEDNEANLPILQIFNTCKLLIETIPACIYSETKTEDIEEFDGDDPIDDLRYFCKTVRQYLNGEIGNRTHILRVQEIVGQLHQDGDMTKFYRQMEVAEGRSSLNVQTGRPARTMGILARRRRMGLG